MEKDNEKPVTIDDYIFITKDMDGLEYLKFMELPGEQREEVARETLRGIK